MRNLLTELKRRNVFRVAIVYIVVGWLTLQVAETTLPAFDIPSWVLRAVVILLILGFPFALIFAWAFEITPEGLKKEKDVDRSQSITTHTGRKLDFMIIGALVIAVAFLLVDKLVLTGSEDEVAQVSAPDQATETSAKTPEKSIAVLPFVNMSGDVENEYFSDGLSEELLNVLAKIPDLKVAGRTSSFQFKGENKDLRQIGKQLGVAHVLEGSVRQSGIKVRITAQLIDTDTGFHLWSETFDRELNDIFAIQDEISASVAAALKVTLLGAGETTLAETHGTENIEAYNAFLQGRYFYQHETFENLEKAIGFLERAIELDPAFAAAHAELSLVQQRWVGGYPDSPEFTTGMPIARESAERALALDDNLPEAHIALAMIHGMYDWDWKAQEREVRRALELDPSNIFALNELAGVHNLWGRFDEAAAVARRALELDPLSLKLIEKFGDSLIGAGRYKEALAAYRRGQEIAPAIARVNTNIGYALMLLGRFDEAAAYFEEEPTAWIADLGRILLLRRTGDRSSWLAATEKYSTDYGEQNSYQIAELYADGSMPDEAFDWLERGYAIRDPGVTYVMADRLLDNLHDDPRWPEFLKKMGFAD
jgi:serine/threonine-protein kinase